MSNLVATFLKEKEKKEKISEGECTLVDCPAWYDHICDIILASNSASFLLLVCRWKQI